MKVRITTLSENSAGNNAVAEWGLGMLVEADGKKILFDTGAGTAAMLNVNGWNLDITDIDAIVLSHGHYDHTGGLYEVLKRTGPKDIYAHPDIWASKYGSMDGTPPRFIGIPHRREALEALGAAFHLSREPQKLSDAITTTGEVPMQTDYEHIEAYLKAREDGELKPDPFNDDLSLVIDTDFGLVVVLGCAHRGIINNLKQAQKVTGKEHIYAAIGGTHLLHASQERLEQTGVALLEMGVEYLGVSHCTGFGAAAYLATLFGDRFFQNNAGTRLELPF